jgi:hypothetical protein
MGSAQARPVLDRAGDQGHRRGRSLPSHLLGPEDADAIPAPQTTMGRIERSTTFVCVCVRTIGQPDVMETAGPCPQRINGSPHHRSVTEV